jgi:type IV pilus assembly protein PilB
MVTTQRQPKQLGQILLEQGLISEEHLRRALDKHRNTPKSLGRVLIDLGYIRERDLVRALAEQVGLGFVDLTEYRIDAAATVLLPEALCRRYPAFPIGEQDGKLLVAMSDPANVYALDDIRTITGRDVRPVVATTHDVEQSIQKFSGMSEQVEALASEAADALDAEAGVTVEAAVEDAPIVRLVQAIMTQAADDRASDVHIEPTETDVRVRFRVDGVLHEVMHSPKSIQGGLISRLKVMSDLNIGEKRIPQDGRLSLRVNNRSLDLRLATLPTVYGEKIVIRILDKTNALLRLSEPGFLPQAFESYERSFRKPYGAILVTGPTGSGKSTTLYATLNIVNSIDRHIVTVEDPVEYRLPGVNQIQVNPKAGLTFASALRSILRADPDIILIGEIRDRETAMIAAESALTGHLVLSSLHTNDAPSAITRLIEMQVETFLVGSAIDCGRPAAGAPALREVQAGVRARGIGADRGGVPRVPDPRPRRVLPTLGVPIVLEYRVPRAGRPVRGHAHDRGDRTPHRRARVVRDGEAGRDRARDVHASRRRAPQGRVGSDLHRRDRTGGEVIGFGGASGRSPDPDPRAAGTRSGHFAGIPRRA